VRLGWLSLLTIVAVGCAGPTAIVRRPNAPPIEGEIASSDASTLRLQGPSGNGVSLGQYEVSEIDHPGNGLAIAGLVFAGASSLFLIPVLLPRRPQDGPGDGWVGFGAAVGIGGIVEGLGVFAYNAIVWGRSKARARAFEDGRPPDWLIPPAAPGFPEPIEPLRLPDGKDDEEPDKRPPPGFHR
jgi:hypothetical protein